MAAGIAAAVSVPEVRAHLRNAMRDSRWTDHKLVLQDYVLTPEGHGLVAAAAAAVNRSPEELLAEIRQLPRLDFYFPFRKHRVEWRGTPDVLVATVYEKFARSITAFAPDGSIRTLTLADGAPAIPLIVLHPAEIKTPIGRNEPRSNGETIEDSRESGIARWSKPAVDGFTPTGQFDMYDPCSDPNNTLNCDVGGGGGSLQQVGVYLVAWDSYRDDGWWGSLELQFQSYGFEDIPTYLGSGFWYTGTLCSKGTLGITSDATHHDGVAYLISPNITNVANVGCNGTYTYHGYELVVTEIDGGLNGSNDDFGRRFFTAGTIPLGGIVAPNGSAWTASWQDYYSGGGNANYADAELSIALALQYK